MKQILPRYIQLFVLLVLVVPGSSAQIAAQIQSGHQAPPFDLPLLNGDDYLNSKDLFPAHTHTFLVFWDSNCPHCVESLLECENFHLEHMTDDIALVGIHTDEGDLFEVHQLIEANGITFPQLWDVGGEAGQNYGISFATFTLFLVDSRGKIIARRADPEGDIKTILESMLHGEMREPPEKEEREVALYDGEAPVHTEPTSAEPVPEFVFKGTQRIRFLGIDARGPGAAGPYGEAVTPGNNLLFRFELEMSRRITKHLRAGGILRISNEDEKVLEWGPEYLGSKWGSAFAELTAGRLFIRLGYYELSMTPLTLMRWDWSDNPRIGGNAGCGCGAAAGVLIVESLEELAPEITFEGGLAVYRISNLEARAFYAIPRRASETSYLEVRSTGAERARYSLEIYGFESIWKRFDSRTTSFWKAGIHLAGNWENRRSVDFNALGYPGADPWYESMVLSADWEIPVIRSVDLEGEWILWNKAKGHGLEVFGYEDPLTMEGEGGIAGIVFERSPGWNIRCDYIRLNPNFYSPFAALSYEPNRKGFRFSAQLPLPGEIAAASLFYKRLRELESSHPDAEKEKFSVFGMSFDLELPNGLGGSVGWLDNGTWRGGSRTTWFDEVRRALVVEARYHFDKSSSVQIQYQRVDGSIRWTNHEDDALTNLYSVYLSARF